MELDRPAPRTWASEFIAGPGNIGQIIEKVDARRLSTLFDILSSVAPHRHCLLPSSRRNARAGDYDFLELNTLPFGSLFVLLFYGRRARSLSLIHLSQAKSA